MSVAEDDQFRREADGVPDGARLLEDIETFIVRFVVLPAHAASALALWVLHTYALDAAEQTPYLFITSPEMQCGKSRLLEVLELVCFRGWGLNGAPSEAVLFRKIDRDTPTLLLDEFDRLLSGPKERVGPLLVLFKSGNRQGATVSRCVARGKSIDVVDFSTFCAKAIVCINPRRWPETEAIIDRAVNIVLHRRRKSEPVERFKRRHLVKDAESLSERCKRWASPRIEELAEAKPACPGEQLSDRMEDAWEPLFAIADAVGERWPEDARKAALALCSTAEVPDGSLGLRLLEDIRGLIGKRDRIEIGKCDRIESAWLVSELCAVEEAPWADIKGKPLGSMFLARLLKPYGVRPKALRFDEEVKRGYEREPLELAFERYLAPTPPQDATSTTSASQSQESAFSDPQQDADVADEESDPFAVPEPNVADVADNGGGTGGARPHEPSSDTGDQRVARPGRPSG